MNTVVISEWDDKKAPPDVQFDLNKMQMKPCIGCWTCWWTTPGRCVHKDLEEFYRAYINADQVIFFLKPSHGFVSVKMKTLLDRMIPLFLPYTEFRNGGTYHTPRYPKYPNVTICYDGQFEDGSEKQIFSDYIRKVFTQFYSKKIEIYSTDEYQKAGVQ